MCRIILQGRSTQNSQSQPIRSSLVSLSLISEILKLAAEHKDSEIKVRETSFSVVPLRAHESSIVGLKDIESNKISQLLALYNLKTKEWIQINIKNVESARIKIRSSNQPKIMDEIEFSEYLSIYKAMTLVDDQKKCSYCHGKTKLKKFSGDKKMCQRCGVKRSLLWTCYENKLIHMECNGCYPVNQALKDPVKMEKFV